MSVGISSWNMQGGGGKEPKLSALFNTAIKHSADDIILVQEEGVPGSTGFQKGKYGNYTCVAMEEDPVATNQRCTTGILVKDGIEYNSIGNLNTYGVNRPIPYIIYEDVVIATVHAIANDGEAVPLVKSILNVLYDNYKYWILMGDFNSEPGRYPVILYNQKQCLSPDEDNYICFYGTTNAPRVCHLIYPGKPTQGANGIRENTFDYAFCSCNIKTIGKPMNKIVIDPDRQTYLSDHNMISMCFEYN